MIAVTGNNVELVKPTGLNSICDIDVLIKKFFLKDTSTSSQIAGREKSDCTVFPLMQLEESEDKSKFVVRFQMAYKPPFDNHPTEMKQVGEFECLRNFGDTIRVLHAKVFDLGKYTKYIFDYFMSFIAGVSMYGKGVSIYSSWYKIHDPFRVVLFDKSMLKYFCDFSDCGASEADPAVNFEKDGFKALRKTMAIEQGELS